MSLRSGWAKLLWRLRKPRTHRARVPLMGVAKKLADSKKRFAAYLDAAITVPEQYATEDAVSAWREQDIFS